MEIHMQKYTLANHKITRIIGTWKGRTMFVTGRIALVLQKMRKYRLNILEISECNWKGSGKINTQTGETIIYSGRQYDRHNNGVAIAVSKEAFKSLLELTPTSDSIASRFWSKYIKKKLSYKYTYPPTMQTKMTKICFMNSYKWSLTKHHVMIQPS